MNSCSAGRPVKRGQETVTRRVDLAAVESFELATDDFMVLLEQVAPGSVADG